MLSFDVFFLWFGVLRLVEWCVVRSYTWSWWYLILPTKTVLCVAHLFLSLSHLYARHVARASGRAVFDASQARPYAPPTLHMRTHEHERMSYRSTGCGVRFERWLFRAPCCFVCARRVSSHMRQHVEIKTKKKRRTEAEESEQHQAWNVSAAIKDSKRAVSISNNVLWGCGSSVIFCFERRISCQRVSTKPGVNVVSVGSVVLGFMLCWLWCCRFIRIRWCNFIIVGKVIAAFFCLFLFFRQIDAWPARFRVRMS